MGGAFGGIGNLINQYMNSGSLNCINWSDFWIAVGTGVAAGAAAPFFATGYGSATALGAAANTAQYAVTQYSHGQGVTASGIGVSVVTGAVGGAIAGPVSRGRGIPFNPNSPWLSPGAAKNANNAAAVAANTGVGNMARSAGAGVASNCECDL
jgi:hypothetical protein